ncbi:MAG: DUF3823 domain-containing protein [Chitinophagaceae bacterium]|nr:MAG: DUF3823 domain-containing protein [Chitinophagaceae bacterium]
MKLIKILSILIVMAFASCEKDNYDAPSAGLSGKFIDAETGEQVQQDIIRGTQIELIEHGYDPVSPQFLLVKNDGSYENSLLFANMYTVRPVRGNFIPVEPQDIQINSNTVLDFPVTPFIRVLSPTIVKSGTKVIATFKLEQNVLNEINKIGLYAHSDSRVGEPMRLFATEQQLNSVSDPATTYTLEIDLAANSTVLKPGTSYYFRIGALISVGEAKLNYAPAVKIDL